MEKENRNIAPINEKENVVTYEIENIRNLIYTIRGKQVMLDSDVAKLYEYKTKVLNLTVKRNMERFPKEFCFQLTESEFDTLRFQFETSNKMNINLRGGRRYLPYVFTEQGIAMLSGVLKSEIAIKMSINIIKAFIDMRKFIFENGQVFERLEKIESKLLEQGQMLSKHEKNFEEVFDEFQKNKQEKLKQKIFFEGQIYDSYSLVIDIIKSAKNKILIIDNYIDDSILKMLSKKSKEVEVIILTSQNCNLNKLDISKFNKQYPSLKISYTNKFYDRFIVIDNQELYHIRSIAKRFRQKMFCDF